MARAASAEPPVILIPLIAKGQALGVLVADNQFSREPLGSREINLRAARDNFFDYAGRLLEPGRLWRRKRLMSEWRPAIIC